MKLARYMGAGVVEIVDEPIPPCPPGGLLVKTEACGLCSGELMDWYMDRKIPHVLGHEVAGVVVESQDERFPVGSRVFPHHHAPCLQCELCVQGLYVHCEQWKRTKLIPGGMAEYFGVPAENLNDTLLVGDMRAVDAALIEPLACVVKSCGIDFQSMRRSTFQVEPNLESPANPTESQLTGIQKKRGGYLPHWTKTEATYFVTFRLADSVPKEVQEDWARDRSLLEEQFKLGRISVANKMEYLKLNSERVNAFLDAGVGECVLRKPECADIVQNALKFFDGERYRLLAWSVMPNHVHAVLTPHQGYELHQILHSWKSFTANKINALLGKTGALWQVESYDHLVRSAEDLARCVRYTVENPAKAGLSDWRWVGVAEEIPHPASDSRQGTSGQDLEGLGTHWQDANATAKRTFSAEPFWMKAELSSSDTSSGQDLEGLGTHWQDANATAERTFSAEPFWMKAELSSSDTSSGQDLEGLGTHWQDANATAVIGLGVMGLMHALLLPGCLAFDINPSRVRAARRLGINAKLGGSDTSFGQDLEGLGTHRQDATATASHATTVFVCPGSQAAFDFALQIASPGATIVMFAPLPPGQDLKIPQAAYFKDLKIVHSYSCGPDDTRLAKELIESGAIQAEQVVSDFIGIDDLPAAYGKMKAGEILKPMVVFP